MKTFPLNSTTYIPALGLGTWKLKGDECVSTVLKALEIGYRHIDTADAYENHQEVAQGIKQSGIKREEIFITTKVWHDEINEPNLNKSAKRFLEELQTDYLDLLLIHWPNKDIPITESLEELNILKQEGVIKAIGVSNFTIHHLQDALKTGIEVASNQVEFHPSLNQKELKNFCDQNKIVITAYSPLARGYDLELPVIKDLSQKYGKTPSQVILNWLVNKGLVAIPKSSNPQRLLENFQSLDWQIDPQDMELIDNINENHRAVTPVFAEFDY